MTDLYVSPWSPMDFGNPYALIDALPPAEPLCSGCRGLLMVADFDGSHTGTVGTLVPCMCLMDEHGYSVRCGCYIEGWPFNYGFTGWLLGLYVADADPGRYFTPCPAHPRIEETDEVAA